MKGNKIIFAITCIVWAMAVILFSLAHFKIEENKMVIINEPIELPVLYKDDNFKIFWEEKSVLNFEKNDKAIKTIDSFYSLSNYERWLVESIVAGESGIEPYWGKVAVASCILNACLLEDKRPEEIQTMYGYAGWKSIEKFESECMAAYGNTDLADEVREAVSQVFDDGEVFNNEILWFYAPEYSSGSWHRTQKFVIEISNHRFYAPWN